MAVFLPTIELACGEESSGRRAEKRGRLWRNLGDFGAAFVPNQP
jgi:hypothetical protein